MYIYIYYTHVCLYHLPFGMMVIPTDLLHPIVFQAGVDPHVKRCMPEGQDPKEGLTARELADQWGTPRGCTGGQCCWRG